LYRLIYQHKNHITNKFTLFEEGKSRMGRAVGIETGDGVVDTGVGLRVPVMAKLFFPFSRARRASYSSKGVKQPLREANYAILTSIEVENILIYTSAPS
jgi:hypothetical protein